MSYYDSLTSIGGMKAIYTILIIATILTVFEIVFFYYVVSPGVIYTMEQQIGNIGKTYANTINTKAKELQEKGILLNAGIPFAVDNVFNDDIENIFTTLSNRENILIKKINNYTKYTGLLIILSLLTVLYLVYSNLIKQGGDDIDLSTENYTAVFTVFCLISFQIMFYFFGQEFRYPVGPNELLLVILDALDVN
mgnify:CR=1 FL=1